MTKQPRKSARGIPFLIALGFTLAFSSLSAAQEWAPSKPLRLIVPYPAGGTSDTIARGWAYLRHHRKLIRLERPSCPRPAYDPVKDAQPLTLVTRVGVALVTNPRFPAKTLAELLEMAKKDPGTIPYGSAGNGLSGHFAGEAMKLAANVDMVHVPYRGGAPGLNDVIAGQIPMMFNVISSVMTSVEGGKVRPLAVTSAQRSKVLPEVPTMAEAGLENVEIYEWYGLVAPAGIPAEATGRLHQELEKVLKQDAFTERMEKQGIEVVANSPEDFATFISGEIERFSALVKSASITLD